jgi:hypothetical protein
MPASVALPPLRRMARAASAASGWAATTICFRALTSGLAAIQLAPSGCSKARAPGASASKSAMKALRNGRKSFAIRLNIAIACPEREM